MQRSNPGSQVESGGHIDGQVDVRSGQTIGSFVHSQIVSAVRYQSLTEINGATFRPCSEKSNGCAPHGERLFNLEIGAAPAAEREMKVYDEGGISQAKVTNSSGQVGKEWPPGDTVIHHLQKRAIKLEP